MENLQGHENYHFSIDVKTEYLNEQSLPEESQFVFTYTIEIINRGQKAAKLTHRHWVITDANGETIEVKGKGVVGEQPIIEPGQSFIYTSGTVISTPIGTMQGSYLMEGEHGEQIQAPIPVFSLAQPSALN